MVQARPDPARINAIVSETRAKWPRFELRGIEIENGLVPLSGQADAILVRDRANKVWFDGRDGSALGDHDATGMNIHQRAAEAVDPLYGGLWHPSRRAALRQAQESLGVHAAFRATDQSSGIPFFTRRLDAVRCALR